jgi:ABC-type transport system involved in multi-copper enzyme maturation permease subunit
MNRKLWLEARPLFLVVLFLSCGFTLLYTRTFQTWGIYYYEDALGMSLVFGPDKDPAALAKEDPRGTLYSLKDAPHNYYKGFSSVTRVFWPVAALILCVGGILAEKTGGTAAFNLSLPVSRAAWLWRKAAMVSLLTLAAAFLTSAFAVVLGLWMGLDWSLVWLLTHPVMITSFALPWIGMSLYVQSWTSPYLSDPVAAATVPMFFTGIEAALLIPTILASPLTGWPWGVVIGAFAVGAGCMVLATRRFERLDF